MLAHAEFTADTAGYEQLLGWLRVVRHPHPHRCRGHRLLRRRPDEVPAPPRRRVVEVNRPDRGPAGSAASQTRLDAESAARRALAVEDRGHPEDTTTIVEAIRVLRIARSGAVKSHTAGYNQPKDLIVTAPDELRDSPAR